MTKTPNLIEDSMFVFGLFVIVAFLHTIGYTITYFINPNKSIPLIHFDYILAGLAILFICGVITLFFIGGVYTGIKTYRYFKPLGNKHEP